MLSPVIGGLCRTLTVTSAPALPAAFIRNGEPGLRMRGHTSPDLSSYNEGKVMGLLGILLQQSLGTVGLRASGEHN